MRQAKRWLTALAVGAVVAWSGVGALEAQSRRSDSDLPAGVYRLPAKPKPRKVDPPVRPADAAAAQAGGVQPAAATSENADGQRDGQEEPAPLPVEEEASSGTSGTSRAVLPADDASVALPVQAVQGTRSNLPAGVTPLPASPFGVKKGSSENDPGKEAAEAAKALEEAESGIVRPGSEPRTGGGGLAGSLTVRPDARTMTLAVPAPRGQITDRHGKPFAQSKVVWYPALMFGQFEKADRAYVIGWARKRIELANQLFGIDWTISDEQLWQHYRHRRWLAMPVTRVVTGEEKKKVEEKLMAGLILHPVYLRHYPVKQVGAHIIGYVGSSGKLEKGPINYGDPIFEFSEGRAGLEKIYNEVLTGKPGLLRKDYEADGTEVVKKFERRPKPGGTVVTTLDLAWQQQAEKVLEEHCSRGAFVVIDIETGEVLTMASRPSFDLNDFTPYISNTKYKELRDDPGTPLFGRAFQGAYPPASTFKPVVALAALQNRDISEHTLIRCPPAIRIGKHWFRNWTDVPEGDINVKRAIARSCNTWFYQVGIQTGPTAFLSVARRLGFGTKTGLPLVGETPGLIPTNEWMKKNHGRRMLDGDTANLSIGQGVMLASPLQVAQGMAGIATGSALPKLRLVKQIQDVGGRVLVSHEPKKRNSLNLDPMASEVVREGMMQVVNSGYGTGQRGGLSFTVVCGKTGTAQWGPESQNKRLAWFAGFFPYENPRFAFAALYEGKPNEKLSGGRKAAPMVSAFFEHFEKDIKIMITPPPKAMVIDESEDELLDLESAPRAVPVEEDEGGLDPAMGIPGADGFVPDRHPARPLTPPGGQDPAVNDPWIRPGQRPPSRAVPVEEDLPAGPDPIRPPVRAIPVEE